jgi:hypothetical protein
MKTRRNQILLLIGLLLFLAGYLYFSGRPAARVAATSVGDEPFRPLSVENPTLRTDLLAQLKKLQYQGSHRNIFSAAPPPPPPSEAVSKPAVPQPPPGPPPIPPLVVPAKFFGHVTDARTGVRRAFFNEGDEVYVLAVGEVLLGRFRLLQIGNNTAELEETASGRRTTLVMEDPGPA